ncbi:MAG: HD domain-containing protein [Bacilli bacterium]|nr:HD domain-containing protein [Bacilli bacterium]
MITYNEIKNDPYIIDIYDKIEKFSNKELYATHGWSHILNVVDTVDKIMKELNVSEEIIECGKIAALLHDIGCINGKDNHAVLGYNMATKYLEGKDMSQDYKESILEAILNHGGSKSLDNIIATTLVFADKIDFDKTRLTPLGYEIESFNQIQYIDHIDIIISDNNLIVKFIVNDMFDKDSLEKYYFTPKIFKAIYNFGEYLNLKPCVKLNDDEWILKK